MEGTEEKADYLVPFEGENVHKFWFGSQTFSALKTAVLFSLPYYVLHTEKKKDFVFKTHQKITKGQ